MKIPDDVLDIVLGESYDGEYTLRSELNKRLDSIIHAEWNFDDRRNLEDFTAWTDTDVLVLIDTIFGDRCIIYTRRNP